MSGRGFLAFACAAALSSSVSADDLARRGPYAALQGVASVPLSDLSRDDTGFGAAGRVGFRVASPFAVEAQVEYSGKSFAGNTRQTFLTLNGKLYVLERRLQPYALLGLGASFPSSSLRNDDASFAVRAGVGADAYLTDHVAIFAEAAYARPTQRGSALDLVSIGFGALYRW
jgi:hypothetical protein